MLVLQLDLIPQAAHRVLQQHPQVLSSRTATAGLKSYDRLD